MSREEALAAVQESLGSHCYHIDEPRRGQLEAALALSTDELLRLLVDYIKPRALCPISLFQVGTVGLTQSGEIFLGVNLEYHHASFAQTVHAEQFLISWARSCSASPLVALAVSAPPCGHCRQFMHEFDPEGKIRLLIGDEPPVTGASLLPRAFTPRDLGVTEPFFLEPVDLVGVSDPVEAARLVAQTAYTPYGGKKAGVAVQSKDGRIVTGVALENAAYNPTLPPLQAALIACHAKGVALSEIESVTLCQGEGVIDYAEQARGLAEALGVAAEQFRVVGL